MKLIDDGTVSVHNIDTNPKGEVEEVISSKYLTKFCNIFWTDCKYRKLPKSYQILNRYADMLQQQMLVVF